MKKFFLFLILLLFPIFIVNASEVNYEIKKLYIQANIQDNGDVKVKELFLINGDFNGYEREIGYGASNLQSDGSFDSQMSYLYKADSLELTDIKGKHVSDITFDSFNDTDYDQFTEVTYANNGEIAKYTKNSSSQENIYRMYYYTNNESTAFLIEYTLKNVVVVHNDVAELNWRFIGSEFTDMIDDVQIKVYLPGEDNTNNFRIWAHGSLWGDIEFINKEGLYAHIKPLESYTSVELRTTFDKSLVSNSAKLSNKDALSSIIDIETDRASTANQQRDTAKRTQLIYNIYNLMAISAIIGLWLYIYFKFDKEYESTFKLKYNREFIDDYNVEVVDYLMNKNITPNAMSASIMNLVYKKNISVIKDESSKKDNYIFTRTDKECNNETEKYLLDFLFDEVGTDNTFSTKQLKEYAESTLTYSKFTTKYTTWKNRVMEDAQKQEFFEVFTSKKLLFAFIAIVLSIGSYFTHNYLPILLIVAFLIYLMTFTKRTKKGNEHYTKWRAFKNFLNDFGQFKEKDLPEIILWERYLVYATIFGLAKKVQNEMNVKIQEMNLSNQYSPMRDYWLYNNLYYSVNHSCNSAVSGAMSTAQRIAAESSSHSSSGGGFGGGFSGGGGFGGGGGGGHGF